MRCKTTWRLRAAGTGSGAGGGRRLGWRWGSPWRRLVPAAGGSFGSPRAAAPPGRGTRPEILPAESRSLPRGCVRLMEETAAGRGQPRQRAARPRGSRGRGTAARRGSTARGDATDGHPTDGAPRAVVPRARAESTPVPRTLSARSRATGGLRLREVLSQLSLGRQDVSEASGLVNHVVSHLIQAVRGRDGSFSSISRLGAGSYYEHVKISEPNEFDIMLVMPVTRLQLDECDGTGAYYYLSFKRSPKEKYMNKFLDEDGKLSADKMLQELRRIIKEEVKHIKNVEVTVKRKKPGSPAITLQIKKPPAEISVDIILALEVQQSWPPSTQDGLNIECWLGRKVRREFRHKPIYLVAKQNKKEKLLRGNTWRLSFSHIEKAMLNNHGSIKTCCESNGVKCCRKDCLKLLKYLLERLKMKHAKELEKFCSYHVKTAFFHSCVTWPSDTDWQYENLEHCFQKYLEYFLRCLQDSQLPHFFIPQYNLLSLDDKASNDFLSRQINYQLNNGFPVFHQA
ncbi:cyclic GMP-AMP synthase isoform X2 [Coturnix japonica]|uniref:cyclic GMP-AMP synthase isoform X2 n=1 Tax=Coturnix japonica TaxID=93934 RepID=UPI000777DA36|nr:cyclic GMP-AMP synthase isoform X2 [Coturnix japonica]